MKKIKTIGCLAICVFVLISTQLLFAKNHSVSNTQNKIVTLDFKKIPVREVLQFIAEAMNYNIIMSESVTGQLSLHFRNITLQQALDLILEMSGLVKKIKGNVLLIASSNEFALRQKSLSEASPVKIIKYKLRHSDVNAINAILKNQNDLLSSLGRISVNPEENSLLIKENLDNLPHLINYLKEIDKPEKQILIAAKIVNIDHKKIGELGIGFSQTEAHSSSHEFNLSLPVSSMNSFQVAVATMAQNQLLNLQLKALETTGHSKIIADPKLVAQNRRTAIIEAGEEIPYQESTSSGATSVTFKKAALSLKVTPTALPDGQIILDLEISQNKVSSMEVNGTPAITTQELKTQAIVKNGQTIILGGIFECGDNQTKSKLPIIGKVPVLGDLISHSKKQLIRKELLIFISPEIIWNNI